MYLILSLFFPVVYAQTIPNEVVDVIVMIRDMLAQQAVTAAFGTIAFSWNVINRRNALVCGPAVSINAIFSSYETEEFIMRERDLIPITKFSLIIAYLSWFLPCIFICIIDVWMSLLFISVLLILQIALWGLWKIEIKFKFPDYPEHRYYLQPENELIEIEPVIDETFDGLRLVGTLDDWRAQLRTYDAGGISLIANPKAYIVIFEKTLRLLSFFIWVMAVGIAAVDERLININLISIFFAALSMRNDSGRISLWANSPSYKEIKHWSKIIFTFQSTSNLVVSSWSDRVVFAKLFPEKISEDVQTVLYKDILNCDDWLSKLLRLSNSNVIRNCLMRYDTPGSSCITYFDLIGIKVWSTIMKIEEHLFTCREAMPVAHSTQISSINIRNRSKMCLLANAHVKCPAIEVLLDEVSEWVSNNEVLYATLAHVFPEYMPSGGMPHLGTKSISNWWYALARKAMCPGYNVEHSILVLIYLYDLMNDNDLDYHFQYANCLEKIALLKGTDVINTPHGYRLRYGTLDILANGSWARLPATAWFVMSNNRMKMSSGMIRTITHLETTRGNKHKALRA